MNPIPPGVSHDPAVRQHDIDSDEALRANTYSLLAALLAAPPSRELLDLVARIADNGDSSGNGLARAWKVLGLAGRRSSVGSLDDEYHALFIGLARGELVPYGSWYLTGLLMDRPLAQLRSDLAALGFERAEDVHEPEDHAAALCETMGLIIAGGEEFGHGVQRSFFSRHMEPWLGQFFADLANAEAACFYRAVGHLGQQFVELERQYLSMPA